jgi:hypothetical protein
MIETAHSFPRQQQPRPRHEADMDASRELSGYSGEVLAPVGETLPG